MPNLHFKKQGTFPARRKKSCANWATKGNFDLLSPLCERSFKMKKRILFFAVIFVFALSTAFAFPFGLKMGMTPKKYRKCAAVFPLNKLKAAVM